MWPCEAAEVSRSEGGTVLTVNEYPRSHGSLSGLSDTDHHPQYALDSQGTIAARPLPGRIGRYYYATDQQVLYRDSGSTWVSVNTQGTLFDAKGDILVGTGQDAAARLPVDPVNGRVLVTDSAAPLGVSWFDANAAYAPKVASGVRAHRGAAQSIPNATETAVIFDAESFDTDGFHDVATNAQNITIPAGKGGKYLITAAVKFVHHATGRRALDIKKGATYLVEDNKTGAAGDAAGGLALTCTTVENLVAGDVLTAVVNQASGAALDVSGGLLTFFAAIRIGD